MLSGNDAVKGYLRDYDQIFILKCLDMERRLNLSGEVTAGKSPLQ